MVYLTLNNKTDMLNDEISFMKAWSKHKEDKGVSFLYNPVSEYERICGMEKNKHFLK